MNFHQPPATYVGQVRLKVQNIERSIQFYEQVIGFKVLERTEYEVTFTADGKRVLLTIEQPNDVVGKTENTTGLYHLALLLPERRDLANIVRHFASIGLQFGSADHLVSEALYLSDPDGNGIEIYIDRHPSEWNWHNDEVAMTTDPLDFHDLLMIEGEWKGLPENTVMGHVHLQVADLEQNEKFYIDGLGFQVVNRYGTKALFISDHHYHHHIALNTWGGEQLPIPSENTVGLAAYSIVLPDEATRKKVKMNLENIGATVIEKDGIYMTYDPSNIRIELKVSQSSSR